MFKTRLLTALIGIPVILGVLYSGGICWQIFFGLLGVLGLHEIFSMMKTNSFHPLYVPGYLLLIILIYSDYYTNYLPLVLFVILFLTVVYAVLRYPRTRIIDAAISITAAAYLGWTLHYAQATAVLPNAFTIMLLALLLTWSSDTGGYMLGRLWGKHKMVPLLSPKKTWEGAAGATVLPVIIAAAAFNFYPYISLTAYLALGLLGGITAQFGDLFISSIKRYFQVKDTGNILPGHGGILDRFDSFLLVIPVVYYFFANII